MKIIWGDVNSCSSRIHQNKKRFGIICRLLDVYVSTAEFERYIKTFEITMSAVRYIKLSTLKFLLQKLKGFTDLNRMSK